MSAIKIGTFVAFANLVIAGCRLALAGDPISFTKSLADIASGAKSLDDALATRGLAAVAIEMACVADDYSRHFTHAGPARDDAIALFWQTAPAAFADPSTFAEAHLDPQMTADRMVAAIKASAIGRDFVAAPLAEQLFRAIAMHTLEVMLNRSETVAALSPALWRQSLRNQARSLENQDEILRLVRELHTIKETTVPQITLIAMARKIRPQVRDLDEALRALDAATDLAAEAQFRGEIGSNVDAFVDETLRRLAVLTGEGALDEAAAAADTAVEQTEAGLIQLLEAAIRQHLIAFDADGAASQIVRKLVLGTDRSANLFENVRGETRAWHERGRLGGVRLDLQVAVALARSSLAFARSKRDRRVSFDDLGTVLLTFGERVGTEAELVDAVSAYRNALREAARPDDADGWALTQNNLGNALTALGEWRSDGELLRDAISAYRESLTVRTRRRFWHPWAVTTSNLGTALATLGRLQRDSGLLREAIFEIESSLEVLSPMNAPEQWSLSNQILGVTLGILGEMESDPLLHERAVMSLKSALVVTRREINPMEWSMIWNNIGDTLRAQGILQRSVGLLQEAIAALDQALSVRTREGTPNDWGVSSGNQGVTRLELALLTRECATARQGLAQIVEAGKTTRLAGNTFFAAFCERQSRRGEELVALFC